MNNSHASLARIYTALTGSTVDENARNQPDVGEPADPDSDVFVEAAAGHGIGNTSMPYRVQVTGVVGVYP